MSGVLSKLKIAVRNPEDIWKFLYDSARAAWELACRRRWGELIGYVSGGVTGENWHLERLPRDENGLVKKKVYGHDMSLNPEDTGISRDLITFGYREQLSNKSYRNELSKLREEVDGTITVLEVGANVGYYLLQTANLLGERARIFAFEPSETNLNILKKNLRANGYDDVICVHAAISDIDGYRRLWLAEESNLHILDSTGEAADKSRVEYHDAEEVRTYTVDGFLEDNDIDYRSVNVLRMDLEGQEIDVFRGMREVLESDSPLLIFVEIHPEKMGVEAKNQIVNDLISSGFELVSVTKNFHKGPYEFEFDVTTLEDLYDIDISLKLIARR